MSLQRTPPSLPPEQSTSTTDALPVPEKSYAGRRLEYALEQWSEHPKVEITASCIGAAVGGAISAWIVGFTLGGLAAAMLGALVGLGVALAFIFILYLLGSPKGLDKKLRQELSSTQLLLEAERAKNAKPDIKGSVKEIHREIVSSIFASGGNDDWFIFINLYVVNHRPAVTTIRGFSFKATIEGLEYETQRVPMKGDYYIKREVRGFGAWDASAGAEWEKLTDLTESNNEPLEQDIGREGWLCYVISNVPMVDITIDDEVTEIRDVKIQLDIIDAKGDSHPVDVPVELGEGEIRRFEKGHT